ncbi:MAG: glycosyltransferase [Candidatus Binatia bacterium]
MNVMVLTPSFEHTSPVQGALLLAKYLHRNGEGILFAALDSRGTTAESLLPEIAGSGVPFHCFEMSGWAGLRHVARVREYVKEKEIDAVVSYSLRPEIVAASLSGVIRVSAVREVLRDQFSFSYGPLAARLLSELRLRALKRHDALFVLTQAMADHLVANGVEPSGIFRVNNFVDVDEVRSVLRNGCGSGGGGVQIGYFGLLNRRKRVDVALRAVAKAAQHYGHENIQFHIAGEGPLRGRLTQLAEELGLEGRTIFHGFLGNPLGLMGRMDLVLLASEAEGLPRCLMEAMALGKTCVASDIPGMSEFIRHGKTGYLFPKNDVDALASLLDEIIQRRGYLDPDVLHDYMLQHYDVQSCGRKMVAHLHEIARKIGLSQESLRAHPNFD